MPSERGEPAIETRLVRVRGRVQGVGYRYACVRQARAMGLTGWVRNRLDESVEAMLQGPPEQVALMCAWMENDVPSALVERIEVTELKPPHPRFEEFLQLPTK